MQSRNTSCFGHVQYSNTHKPHKEKKRTTVTSHFTSLQDGNATFQVAIASSETEAYAIVSYKQKEMNWKFHPTGQPSIDVGFTNVDNIDHKCQDLVLSRTRKILHLDGVQGNVGKETHKLFSDYTGIESGNNVGIGNNNDDNDCIHKWTALLNRKDNLSA